MRAARRDEQFVAFVREHRAGLVRTAAMWCHGDVHRAEDLVQTTLSRVYVTWPRVADGSALAYTRRALFNALLDDRRRPVSRRERSTAAVPDRADPRPTDLALSHTVDAAVLAALSGLPTRMRAAVVLRHLDALSVAETAAVLRCSEGTVKSQTARGLERLRAALDHGLGSDPPHVPSALTPAVTPPGQPVRLRPTIREALR